MPDSDELIKSYQQAFRAANGRELYHVWYENGWFMLRHDAHGYVSKYRRKQIEAFRDSLLARAREAKP